MKRMLRLTGALWVVCVGVIGGTYTAGHVVVGWPFNFFGLRALPENVSTECDSTHFNNDVFPLKVGGFSRATFPVAGQQDGRVVYSCIAQYFPPSGDKQRDSVFVTAWQFAESAQADLLINPSDWRLHSATTNIFYALSPVPYVFRATNGDYHDYVLEFVSGHWNVKIECTNDQNLIAFVNQYRH
ncbi:MAG: hypothetical protein ACYDBJ_01925 [Aggregatilineales bacterium]